MHNSAGIGAKNPILLANLILIKYLHNLMQLITMGLMSVTMLPHDMDSIAQSFVNKHKKVYLFFVFHMYNLSTKLQGINITFKQHTDLFDINLLNTLHISLRNHLTRRKTSSCLAM